MIMYAAVFVRRGRPEVLGINLIIIDLHLSAVS